MTRLDPLDHAGAPSALSPLASRFRAELMDVGTADPEQSPARLNTALGDVAPDALRPRE